MSEPSDETLAAWLADVSVDVAPPDVKPYQAALTHVLNKTNGTRALDLVALAHGAGDDDAREWLVGLIREKKDDFLVGGNAELVARLAAAAVVKSLNASGKAHVVLGLAVQSAAYVGLSPSLPEVVDFADAALRAAAVQSRTRSPWQPIAKEIDELLEGTEEIKNAETNVVEQEADDGHFDAIARLAEAVDLLGASLDARLALVDEEYDTLWWSYTQQSSSRQVPWSEVSPLGLRVVLVANELGSKVSRMPSPPIVPGLIGLALGDKRDKPVSLNELATHVHSAAARVPDIRHRLLPISSAVAELRRLGDDDESLWPKSLKAAMGIDAARQTEASAAAFQLIRENEIGSALV